jgi:hypothetical protein
MLIGLGFGIPKSKLFLDFKLDLGIKLVLDLKFFLDFGGLKLKKLTGFELISA